MLLSNIVTLLVFTVHLKCGMIHYMGGVLMVLGTYSLVFVWQYCVIVVQHVWCPVTWFITCVITESPQLIRLSALTTQLLQQCNNCDHQNRMTADRYVICVCVCVHV